MQQEKLRPAYMLSVLLAILMIVQSAGALLLKGLYRDNSFVQTVFLGNDLITLFVAAPLFISAVILARRGSQRALLVWIGMLDYALYNYAYYLFATSFNWFFLLYVVLFGLSIYTLIFALVNLDAGAISRAFKPRTPVKLIASYMLFIALGLTSVYLAQSIGFILTGEAPLIVTKSGHITNVVFALDLSLVIPVLVLGAIWLWKRQPWGYILSTMVNIKAVVYMLALCTSTILVYRVGLVESPAEVVLWGAIGLGSLIASLLLIGNMQDHK